MFFKIFESFQNKIGSITKHSDTPIAWSTEKTPVFSACMTMIYSQGSNRAFWCNYRFWFSAYSALVILIFKNLIILLWGHPISFDKSIFVIKKFLSLWIVFSPFFRQIRTMCFAIILQSIFIAFVFTKIIGGMKFVAGTTPLHFFGNCSHKLYYTTG